jgi:hypothetical protein
MTTALAVSVVVVNALAVLGMVLHVGVKVGHLRADIGTLRAEVALLRVARDDTSRELAHLAGVIEHWRHP